MALTSPTGDNPKRIHLISSRGDVRLEEDEAGGAITPGMLLATEADGEVIAHATAGGYHERKFALEDSLQGRTINDDYAAGELVRNFHAEPGDVVYALLSGGETATVDEYLTSNGDGTLKVATSTDIRVGKAMEAVDASDSNDQNERIRVRII